MFKGLSRFGFRIFYGRGRFLSGLLARIPLLFEIKRGLRLNRIMAFIMLALGQLKSIEKAVKHPRRTDEKVRWLFLLPVQEEFNSFFRTVPTGKHYTNKIQMIKKGVWFFGRNDVDSSSGPQIGRTRQRSSRNQQKKLTLLGPSHAE